MIRAGLVRRIIFLEAVLQAPDVPPREGLHALLTWCREHPPDEDNDPDPNPDPMRPLTGLGRLLAEAKDYMKDRKGHDHHG